ncbi:MAG: ATP-binding protein [Chitinophagales bacterium]
MSEQIARLKIQSRLENVAKVESLMDDIRTQFSIEEEQYGKLLLASVEAVTNAIEHGNHHNENKIVQIIACKNATTFRLCIIDEGDGFNPDLLPDPTAPENIEQPDGRGVFLMKKLADEIYFTDGGRCVEMRFYLS